VPIGDSGSVDLKIGKFGQSLPKMPGVYVVLVQPRTDAQAARGYGEMLFVSETDNIDSDIGSGHGGHRRFWSFIAAEAAEVGYVCLDDQEERRQVCADLMARHSPSFH